MRIIEQMEEALRLLEATKEDLKEWIDVMEEDGWTAYDDSTKESRELIGEVESLLHEIGV